MQYLRKVNTCGTKEIYNSVSFDKNNLSTNDCLRYLKLCELQQKKRKGKDQNIEKILYNIRGSIFCLRGSGSKMLNCFSSFPIPSKQLPVNKKAKYIFVYLGRG